MFNFCKLVFSVSFGTKISHKSQKYLTQLLQTLQNSEVLNDKQFAANTNALELSHKYSPERKRTLSTV